MGRVMPVAHGLGEGEGCSFSRFHGERGEAARGEGGCHGGERGCETAEVIQHVCRRDEGEGARPGRQELKQVAFVQRIVERAAAGLGKHAWREVQAFEAAGEGGEG